MKTLPEHALYMTDKIMNWTRVIEDRFPGLIAKVRKEIEDSEKNFQNGKGGFTESHLWEHTTHVASIAFRLARAEKRQPLLPTLAALFHDAGKFAGGLYHGENTIEEEESAKTAMRVLGEAGMKPAELARTLAGIKALYNEKASKNSIAAIVHDADFLSKSGAMGVAAFFTKATLRGRTMEGAILSHLSKELTYAACLPQNMRTAAGKKLAAQKARDTIRFFRKLISELKDSGAAGLRIRRMRISDPRSRKRNLEILLATSPKCPQCGRSWQAVWFTENGVKCTKLNVEWHCAGCGGSLDTSFCLPEV
jgi:HD superfamily phosphodiesterase